MPDTVIYKQESILPIKTIAFSSSTQVVFIGDSLTSGTGATGYNNSVSGMFSRLEFSTDWFLYNGVVAYRVVNSGTGGETTAAIAARFSDDVLAYSPPFVVIQGGVNDINQSVSESTFLANWESMLDDSVSNGIVPIVVLLPPWTNADETKSTTRDTWNDDLEGLASEYTTARVVDLRPYIGQFRIGGPVGNWWDINTDYSADGLHLVSDGYKQIARAIYDVI